MSENQDTGPAAHSTDTFNSVHSCPFPKLLTFPPATLGSPGLEQLMT